MVFGGDIYSHQRLTDSHSSKINLQLVEAVLILQLAALQRNS